MTAIKAFQLTQAKNKNRPASIRFRLNHGARTQISYTSQLKIAPIYWSNDTQSIRAKVAYDETKRYEFNQRILQIKSTILDWFHEAYAKGLATSQNLKVYMDSLDSGSELADNRSMEPIEAIYELYLSNSDFSENRRKQHRVIIRDLLRYQAYKATVSRVSLWQLNIADFDIPTARDFRFFLEQEHLIQIQYPEIYRECRPIEKRGKNTVLAKLSALRAFVNWANKEGMTTHHPFQGMKLDDSVYGEPYLLTVEEISQLKRTRLHRHPMLEYYRDAFLFQSAVGCRLSDLRAFRALNVSKSEDGLIVEYIAEKTHRKSAKVLRVPLNDTATEIYMRRFSDKAPLDYLFTGLDGRYNKALKKIFLAARLTRYFNYLDPKTGRVTQERLCDKASSHMARRNFIGQMFEVFNDQNLVAELSGHAYNSKQFIRYRKVTDDLRKKMVKKALKW